MHSVGKTWIRTFFTGKNTNSDNFISIKYVSLFNFPNITPGWFTGLSWSNSSKSGFKISRTKTCLNSGKSLKFHFDKLAQINSALLETLLSNCLATFVSGYLALVIDTKIGSRIVTENGWMDLLLIKLKNSGSIFQV